MKSSNLFSLFAGILTGVFIVLLFQEKPRTTILCRSQWLTDNPRGYMLILVLVAAVLLSVGYLLSVRYP